MTINDNHITIRQFIDLICTYGDEEMKWSVTDYTIDVGDFYISSGLTFIDVTRWVNKYGDHIITSIWMSGGEMVATVEDKDKE